MKADDEFYEQFLAPLESRMLRTVWRIVRDTEMARDTLQDAMATIWKRRDTIRHHPNPEALVLRICINASYDALRKYLHCRQYEQAGIEASFSSIDKPGLASDLSNRELAEEILAAIRRLTRNQAVAVLMRVLQDQPYPVIAQALGCSEPTARIHIMRARGRLSSWLSHLAPSRKRKGGIQ